MDAVSDSGPSISVHWNGELRRVPAGLNLENLLRHCGCEPRLVVVELNGTILPRSAWPQRQVVESDAIEVVTIVGGGA